MSDLKRGAVDLFKARVMLQRLVKKAECSTGRTSKVLIYLGDLWRNLQVSLAKAHTYLERRLKELELKEKEINASEETLQKRQNEIELKEKEVNAAEEMLQKERNEVKSKYEWLLDCEQALSKRLEQEKLMQEEVKKQHQLFELEIKRLSDCFKELQERTGRKTVKVEVATEEQYQTTMQQPDQYLSSRYQYPGFPQQGVFPSIATLLSRFRSAASCMNSCELMH